MAAGLSTMGVQIVRRGILESAFKIQRPAERGSTRVRIRRFGAANLRPADVINGEVINQDARRSK